MPFPPSLPSRSIVSSTPTVAKGGAAAAYGGESAAAVHGYVERSSIPLNPRGWTTFRRVGCFSRGEGEEETEMNRKEKKVKKRRKSYRGKNFRESPHHPPGGSGGEGRGGTPGPSRRRAKAAPTAGTRSDEEASSDDDHQRRLSLAGIKSLRLESPGRTPESCAKHCSRKIGGGIGFFGISSGDG